MRDWVKQHSKMVLAGSIVLGIVGIVVFNAGVEQPGTFLFLLGVIGVVVTKRITRQNKTSSVKVNKSVKTTPAQKQKVRTKTAAPVVSTEQESLRVSDDALVDGDSKWMAYGEQSKKHIQDKNYGLYRNTRYDMAMHVKKENKPLSTLSRLTEVIFWDLTGCGNNFNYSTFFETTMDFLFPYDASIMTLAPGVIREVGICQEKIGLSDEQLKEKMMGFLHHMTAPVQFFTYAEIVDIFFWERDGDTERLKEVYAIAKKRFNPKHPNAV